MATNLIKFTNIHSHTLPLAGEDSHVRDVNKNDIRLLAWPFHKYHIHSPTEYFFGISQKNSKHHLEKPFKYLLILF